jgi:adenine-specific DNA methylase
MDAAYPKRLIEVDLPIARISAHARREKSIRHGHISTLHIWWARRPLAACRAVICAALWPDPADPLCPQEFRDAAAKHLLAFARRVFPEKLTGEQRHLQNTASPESLARWQSFLESGVEFDAQDGDHQNVLRFALLDFIADFANWDNSTVTAYLETSRALTQAAHESFGGVPGTRPLVADPFAGGASIPMEALRIGADAFASDLNPVAVLLNKIVLEQIPKYETRLADEIRNWGRWVKELAEKELAEFYPNDRDGGKPIAYLWARTILSEAPGQGDVPVEVPLLRTMWLCKREKRKKALRWVRENGEIQTTDVEVTYADGTTRKVRRPLLEVFEPSRESEVEPGTVARNSATCPITKYTTPANRVRMQLSARKGGSIDARLCCVVTTKEDERGRHYRTSEDQDYATLLHASRRLLSSLKKGDLTIPDEPTPEGKGKGAGRAFSQRLYGMTSFADLYTSRQLLTLATFAKIIRGSGDSGVPTPVRHLLALALGRVSDLSMTLCRWVPSDEFAASANGGQNRMPVLPDFAETNPLGGAGGDWLGQIEWVALAVDHIQRSCLSSGNATRSAAQDALLPAESIDAFITDPPYYDAFPYSDLSDFFFVWLKRALGEDAIAFNEELVPKNDEIVVYDVVHGTDGRIKDHGFFQAEMTRALASARVGTKPQGIGLVVFANKTTSGWESLIQSIIDAGWTATASWPIDTERPSRQRALSSAALGSSVHVVCRPREDASGRLSQDTGEWRDVLSLLPIRIHEWMARLASEGVVGADAIFACLGPALEIFSRYRHVEKADGSPVPLSDYLAEVWASVSTEALSMIFHDADAAGLEPDARLTAMWLWTLGGGTAGGNGNGEEGQSDDDGDDDLEPAPPKANASGGYSLEFDAARKIAQGLGIHLERSESIVEVKGDTARLLPVSERTRYLFGKEDASATAARGRKPKKTKKQMSLFEELDAIEAEVESGPGVTGVKPPPGETVLDRVHQAMILFAGGRGEALRRFLVDDGAGADARFWKLAQSLSALYPKDTDEKRWVDGVLARKKGLGF